MAGTKDGGKIKFGVQFDVQKSSLNEITKALKGVQDAAKANKGSGLQTQFNQAAEAARKLESIVSGSWNYKLDQLNLNKFNKSVKESFGDVKQLKAQLTASGPAGQAAFNSVAQSVLNTNVQLRQSNTLLDSMATSMKNTIKWGITASIFNKITGSIQQAFYYAKDLDLSLTDIRMVTGVSADQMQRFAKNANQVSQNLARSTLDYTKAAVGFYRQGLGDEDVAQRTELTLKAQNVTGAGQEMADYLTSVWNGFKATNEQAEHFGDAMAKVADSSASDMSEIATAMSKVAATAETVGVGFDQLNAQIATVVAATRLAPESVGTAFKTMFARINDIKTGADEAEISLGNYSGRMAQLGFNVLDASGNLRDTGQVIEEIGGKWNTLTKEQQTYLASTMGGQRQITQVMALFNNWDKYVELLNTSLEANGTLNEKNNIYLESTKGHMQQLSTEAERLYAALVDTDAINPLIDTLKGALSLFNDFIEGIGGGTNAFINLGAIAANVFSKQIAGGINNAIQNVERLINNFKSVGTIRAFSQQTLSQVSTVHASKGDNITSSAALEKQAAIAQRTLQVRKGLTNEQYNELQTLQQKIGIHQNELDYLSQYKTILKDSGLSEEASLQTVKDLNDYKKNELNLQQQLLSYMQLQTKSQNALTAEQAQRVAAVGDILNTQGEQAGILANISTEQSNILEKLQNGELQEDQIRELIKKQKELIEQQRQEVERLTQAEKGREAAANGTYQAKKRQVQAEQKVVKATQDQAARNIKIQKTVRGITGGVQAVSSLVGGLTEALDSTNSAAQRLNGIFQGVSGTAAGIANIFLPGSGILVQGIFGLIKGGLNLLGVWDDLEFAMMSSEEKLARMKQDLSDIAKETNPHKQKAMSLQGNVEEFEDLYRRRNLLTEEETERYHELVNQFTQYNEAVIVGYDKQGNAIIDYQGALRDTIQLERDAAREAAQRIFAENGGSQDYAARLDNTAAAQSQDFAQAEQNMLNISTTAPTKARQLKTLLDVQGNSPFNLQAFLNDSAWEDYYTTLEENQVFEIESFKELGFQNVEDLKNAINDVVNQYQNIETDEQAQAIQNKLVSIWQAFITAAIIQDDTANKDILVGAVSTLMQTLAQGAEEASEANIALDQAAEELDKAADGLELYYDSIFNLLKYGADGASDAYQELQKSEYYDSSLVDNALMEYLESFKVKAEGWGQNVLDQANKLSDNQGLQRAGEAFIEAMMSTLTKVSPNIDSAKQQLSQFEGNVDQYNEEVIKVINQIIKQSYTSQELQSLNQAQIAALQELLQAAFNIDNLQINTDNIKDSQFVEEIKTQKEVLQEDLQSALIESFGDLTITPQKLGFNINLQGLDFNLQDLDVSDLEFLKQHIQELNIPELIYRIGKQSQDPAQAFHEVFQQLKNDVNGVADATQKINFSDVYDEGWDKLLKAVENGDKLSDSQDNLLNILEQEDLTLKNLKRGSDQYNKKLSERKNIAEDLYNKELEQERVDLLRQKAIYQFMSLFAGQQVYASKILQIDQKLANIEYEQVRIERDKNAELEKNKKTQQEILNLQSQQTQNNITNVKTLKDTVEKLKDPTTTLESGDFSALNYFLQNDEQAARIAAETDGGIYSDTFIDYVSNAVKDESLLQGLYAQSVEQAQQAIDSIQEKLNDEKFAHLISDQSAKAAQERIDNGETQQFDYEILRAYNQQTELRKEHLDLTIQLEAAQAGLLEAQHQENEQQRIALASGEALLNIYTNLADKVASQGRFGPDLQGDELIQWEATLDRVAEKYPQLETQANLLKDTWLSGTTEYREALRQVQHALYQLERSELESDENAIVDKLQERLEKAEDEQLTLDINIDPQAWESFVNDVENFCDIEHDIIVSIHSDAEDAFDSLKSQMDEIYEAASKIGEGYKVAADDVREVNNVFPGILENAQILHDGTVQLNRDAVQQAIAGASDTAAADAQSVNQQLQSQANLLRTKAINYQQAANLAKQLASGELQIEDLTAEQRSTLFENYANAKQDMSNQAASQEEKDLNAVGTTASQVGGDMANSMAQAATSVVGSFAQMTNKAISNLQTIALALQVVKNGGVPSGTGDASAVSSTYNGGQASTHSNVTDAPSVLNSYSGSGPYMGATGTIGADGIWHSYTGDKQLQIMQTEQSWNEIADMFEQLAADANSAANDIQGMMVGNAAMTQSLANGLGNVAAGSGISPKGGSGGGGGGGGSGSEDVKDPDFMEYLEDEADRYHDIDIRIKQLNDDLEELQELQDKLYGQDLIDNLNDQLGLLEAQNKAYQKKIDIAKDEAAELRGKLAADQVAFDAEGNIINYADALGAKLQWVNNTIEYYNNLTAQEQEAYKDTVEAAKEEYQKMKETIERYDEVTTELIPELSKNIRDNLDKEVEIKISRFKMSVEIRLDMSKAERDWNKFRKEVIDMIRDDDVLGNARAQLRDFSSYYNQAGTAAVQDLTRQLKGTLDQLYQMDATGTSDVYGNNRSQALEDLKNYLDQIESNMQDVEELVNKVKESIFDAIDNVDEAMDEQKSDFEFITNQLDHDAKLVELIYGKDAYESLAKYYKLQQKNNNAQLKFLKESKQYWQKAMLAEQATMMQQIIGSNEWAESKKRFDAYKKNWQEAVEDLNKTTEQAIQNIIDEHANAIDKAMDALNKRLTNGKGLDYVKEEWQLINENIDRYYDKINAMYEINKFENSVKQALNDTIGNVKAQQSLNGLMEEQLKYLKDKDKLTKYDVDRANALLQIELKRLALEQARSSKTKLRLRRDSQGNYNYQYVANQDETLKAQQDLADAQNDLWNLDLSYKRQLGNDLVKYYEEWSQKIVQIEKDTTLTVAEQQAKKALLNEQYGQLINQVLDENLNVRNLMTQDAFNIYSGLYNEDIKNFETMTQAEKDAWMGQDGLVPTWNSGVEQMAEKMSGEGGFVPSTKDAMGDLKDATDDYYKGLQEIATNSGQDFDKIQQGIDETVEATQIMLDYNSQVIESYQNELEAVRGVLDQVKQLVAAYQLAKQAAIAAADEAYKYWMKEQDIAAQRAEAEAKANEVIQVPYDAPQTYVAATPTLNYNPQPVYTGGYSGGGYSGGSGGYGGGSSGGSNINSNGSQNNVIQAEPKTTSFYVPGIGTATYDYDKNKTTINASNKGALSVAVQRFDTGGYTGSWSDTAKVALLDQKELVLNQEDTENILNAVDIVRGMNDWLSSMYDGINIPSTFRGAGASQNTTLDQNVHITAQFPNVSDHTEIERALETLVNRASQFAFNTSR